MASYGVNKFVVKCPHSVKRQYPDHVTNLTMYGRLVSETVIVNVNFDLEYSSQVVAVSYRCQ